MIRIWFTLKTYWLSIANVISTYGIFTNIYPKHGPNVGKYALHEASGIVYQWVSDIYRNLSDKNVRLRQRSWGRLQRGQARGNILQAWQLYLRPWVEGFPFGPQENIDIYIYIYMYVCMYACAYIYIYIDWSSQWEFQDPKMELLYHIRPLPYMVGTSNSGFWNGHWSSLWYWTIIPIV